MDVECEVEGSGRKRAVFEWMERVPTPTILVEIRVCVPMVHESIDPSAECPAHQDARFILRQLQRADRGESLVADVALAAHVSRGRGQSKEVIGTPAIESFGFRDVGHAIRLKHVGVSPVRL